MHNIKVASSVERPAAEGEEAAKVNGHAEVEVNLKVFIFYMLRSWSTVRYSQGEVEVNLRYFMYSQLIRSGRGQPISITIYTAEVEVNLVFTFYNRRLRSTFRYSQIFNQSLRST